MEAIDKKILKELQALPEELKNQVLGFIEGLKKSTQKISWSQGNQVPENDDEDTPEGYGNAKEYLQYIPDNLDKISASEDFEEYM